MADSLSQELALHTPRQWKALSHPLRLRILGLLTDRAMTNEELASALEEQSGKLYFHTKRLLDAGLIVLDHTRRKGPITEKVYRAVARRLTAPPPEKGGAVPPLDTMFQSALDLYRNTWRETGGLPGEIEAGFHLVLALAPERRQEFAARLTALCEEFKHSGSNAPDARPVSLAVLLHSFDNSKRNTDATSDYSHSDARPADLPGDARTEPGG